MSGADTAKRLADPHRALRPGGGRHCRRADRRGKPASRTSSPATWAAPASTCRLIADGEERALAAQTSTIDFGLVVRTPMIEITTIGAGGGSIAWVDRRRPAADRAGKSAGADPGPVCYGLGNDRPTVTDANVASWAGSTQTSRSAASWTAWMSTLPETPSPAHVGQPLGLDTRGGRRGGHPCVSPTPRMAGAIRLVSIERGHATRPNSSLMPFGGGGALHCRRALIQDVGLGAGGGATLPGRDERARAASSPTCATTSWSR